MKLTEKYDFTEAQTKMLAYTPINIQSQWNQRKTTSTVILKNFFGIQIHTKNGWTIMEKHNVQWTWSPVPGMETTCSNWYNRVHPSQIQTKIQNRNLCDISMRHQTTKNRTSQNKTHCRNKYNILYRRSYHTHIRLNHNENRCKQCHIRHQIEIHVHGRQIFLPK